MNRLRHSGQRSNRNCWYTSSPNLVGRRILDALEDVLDFLEVIVVLLAVFSSRRIEGGIHLDLDDVTEILLRLHFPPAQVANIANHSPDPRLSAGLRRHA